MDRPRRAGLRAKKTIPHSTQPTGVFRGLANMHHSSFAKQWHSLSAGKPGHRFRDRYYSNKKNSEQRWAGRIVRFALAAVILVGAAVLTVIPGPAIPLFLVAGALIASDWLWMAKIMDRIEVGLRKIAKPVGKFWQNLPTYARVLLALLMTTLSVTASIVMYRLMR